MKSREYIFNVLYLKKTGRPTQALAKHTGMVIFNFFYKHMRSLYKKHVPRFALLIYAIYQNRLMTSNSFWIGIIFVYIKNYAPIAWKIFWSFSNLHTTDFLRFEIDF